MESEDVDLGSWGCRRLRQIFLILRRRSGHGREKGYEALYAFGTLKTSRDQARSLIRNLGDEDARNFVDQLK